MFVFMTLRWLRALLPIPAVVALAACTPDPVLQDGECDNVLSAEEEAAGWRLLFDGASIDQWRSFGEEGVDDGWVVEGGCLTRAG